MSDPILIPTILSAAISGAGSLAQGAINWFSEEKNRQMQIDLANTKYQRGMEDLRKANINPLMAGRLGGADTPTLQAPQMTGIEQAANEITPLTMSKKQYQIEQQHMQIQQTEAETKRINAEKDKALADAALTNTTNKWFEPRVKQEMQLQEAQEKEALAKTATEDALRIPRIHQIIQETALTTQQFKTEEQRTKEMTEIARNATKLYGARADEALTIANQAATYYKNFFTTKETQGVTTRDLEIELLKNKNFQIVIENILKNDYGRFKAISEIDWLKQL